MRLRVLLPFGFYRKGDLIDPPAGEAGRLLAQRYLGRPLVEAAPAPPPAAPQPENEPPRRHRRRR